MARRRLLWILPLVLAFLVISALLARFLNVENTERDAILGLLRAQAAGDAPRLIRLISGCAAKPTCVARETANAATLKRPGDVKILLLQSHTAYSLTGATGRSRVAWTVIGHLPVVQCAVVHRSGNAITGLSVTLLGLSAPIPNTATC